MKFESVKDGYKALWQNCQVTSVPQARKQAQAIIAVKDKYREVSKRTGIPWFVLGIIQTREAGSPPDFKAVLHNGERIIGTGRKTKLVPKDRGPFSDWDSAAVDAIEIEGYGDIDWSKDGIERTAFVLERFNGVGYRSHGIPSPYLWGGTSVQKPGKYVRDGVYDPGVMDTQIGGMALLKELMELDPSVSFSKPVVSKKVTKEVGTGVAVGTGITLSAIFPWLLVGLAVVALTYFGSLYLRSRAGGGHSEAPPVAVGSPEEVDVSSETEVVQLSPKAVPSPETSTTTSENQSP